MSGLYSLLNRHLFSLPLLNSLRITRQNRLQTEYKLEDGADLLEVLDRGNREAQLKFCLFKSLHDCDWTPVKLRVVCLLPHTNCWHCSHDH